MELSGFLVPLVIMNLVVLFFSVLILIFKELLREKRQFKLQLNTEKKLMVQGGGSLLSTLFENHYFLPSGCGGKGKCGYCKVKVPKGGSSISAAEGILLERKQIKSNVRLACQVRLKNDLVVEIPEEYFKIQEFEACIHETSYVNELTKEITFQLKSPSNIVFKLGQYIQVLYDFHGEMIQRGYVIASLPSQSEMIKINVQLIEGGIMSTYLHSLREGDKVRFLGPCGDSFSPDSECGIFVGIAGGVGISPFKSIIQNILEVQPTKQIYLFYGVKDFSKLFDHDFFSSLFRTLPNFHYFPAFSEEIPGPDSCFLKGIISKIFQENFLENEAAEAVICGPTQMIDSLIPLFRKKDFVRINQKVWARKNV
ncbi:MAG: 2Fe-2S iron-sulfur cluster binding domain-containing protein [Candidatus Riflebacteria bacterium]|nr:2Fe-2S iron-sulfur cluster binding domain-containing protein [Candidatus Riflebacteria bacterium]